MCPSYWTDSSIKYCLLQSSGSRHMISSVFLREFSECRLYCWYVIIQHILRVDVLWYLLESGARIPFICRIFPVPWEIKPSLLFRGLNALVYIKLEWPHRLEDCSWVIDFADCCELHMFDYFFIKYSLFFYILIDITTDCQTQLIFHNFTETVADRR